MKSFKSSRSLYGRFSNAVLSAAAALLAIVTIVAYVSAKSYYLQAGEASARASVDAVEQTLAIGVYAQDKVLLQELVSGLLHHPSIGHVALLDATQTPILPTPNPAEHKLSEAETALPPSFTSNLASPFKTKESVGRLDVWLDTRRLAIEATRQAGVIAGALMVLLAAVVLIFNQLAHRFLSLPMHRLAEKLSSIVPGTDGRLVCESRHENDEVGVVTRAANHLLALQQTALERERAVLTELTELEARYRGIFDSTSAGIFILSGEGRLLHANPALGRLLDMPAEQLVNEIGADFASQVFVRPAQLVDLITRSRKAQQPIADDLELVRDDGRPLWVHCMVSISVDPISCDDRVEGVLYDITRRKLKERNAQHRAEHDALTGLKSRAYIESALSQQVGKARDSEAAVTLMFIDLDGFKGVNDRWGHAAGDAVLIEAANRLKGLFKRNCDLIGRLGGDELVVMITGMNANDPSVAKLAAQLLADFAVPFQLPNGHAASVGASVGVASYPLHATTAKTLIHAADAAMYAVKQSGKGRFVIAEVRHDVGSTGFMDDIDALGETQWVEDIPRDTLTGLMGRREVVGRLALEHARVRAGGKPAGVLCLDIDQFKVINVAHGEQLGDEVLREAARRFTAVLRRGDVVARTGSDEFIVIVAPQNEAEEPMPVITERIGRKLLNRLFEPFLFGRNSIVVRASAGASVIEGKDADGMEALHQAQLALRRSKAMGHGHLSFFKQEMMDGVNDRLAIETELLIAIGTEQLFLEIQPQISRNGSVVAGEALLRWQHPTRGLIPPDQFIPIAEACGIIVDLGNWVLREGCKILRSLNLQSNNQALAINISPVQFNHPSFIDHVRDALSGSGAPADGLILEITEGLLITDVERVADRLRELVALGVRFSIDDFGTGFSSLAYLQQLPLYEIKIDRRFVNGLPDELASGGIVRSILSMGLHLGLNVVAEGVETEEQSAYLSRLGCPVQQGWLHARPMPVEKFLEFSRLKLTNESKNECSAAIATA
jgi:diguanylate cyclase (GGDEF)-like protein/PAS domain S-box-containing protein